MNSTPTMLVQDQFHDAFPSYPDRRMFRVRFMDAPDLLAECSEIEHDGHLWRMVRISSDDGSLYEGHVKVAQTTFFPENVELALEGNPATGRLRISQKLAALETDEPAETETPAETGAPAETETPVETEAPAEPEDPSESQDPSEPEDPPESQDPSEPESSPEP